MAYGSPALIVSNSSGKGLYSSSFKERRTLSGVNVNDKSL